MESVDTSGESEIEHLFINIFKNKSLSRILKVVINKVEVKGEIL